MIRSKVYPQTEPGSQSKVMLIMLTIPAFGSAVSERYFDKPLDLKE
jgi:hypothetical protein